MRNFRKPIWLLSHCGFFLLFTCLPVNVTCQSIATKLNELVTFETKNPTTEGQLLDFARRFQIPMGLELVVGDQKTSKPQVHISNEPAINALKQIVGSDGAVDFDLDDDVVHVFSRKYEEDIRNFLNIRLRAFDIKDESLIGAGYYLNLGIRMQLKPDLNYGGGYGFGLKNDFHLKTITLSVRNITVREILDKLIAIQGNAVWVVRLKPTQTPADSAFYVLATAANGDGASNDFFWQFLHLHESSKP